MKSKLLHEITGQRTYVVILATDDEIFTCLNRFAAEVALTGASLTAIGAFSRATVAYFDWESKSYLPIPVEEQVEVAALIGDITVGPEGGPAIHIHVVLGKRDGSAIAGHLIKGEVRPTLEIVLTESPKYLRKHHDSESGLALISADN